MLWTYWGHKNIAEVKVIPQHALLHRSISVTLLTRGNRQRWGRKAGGTTVGHQWMTKTGLRAHVGKLSGVLGLFLGRSVGLCSLSALGCQCSTLTAVPGADNAWFALSCLGQLICDPVLKLATSKYIQPLLLESGTPSVFVVGANYQWADVCRHFR